MSQVRVIARHTIAEGHRDEVLGLLSGLVDLVRAEPGVLAFDVYTKADDPNSYAIIELYASREAIAVHRETDHFKNILLARIVPLLASRTVEDYDIVS